MAPDDRDRLDRWLDAALQQYGTGEPGPGLEDRILADLSLKMQHSYRGKIEIGLRWWCAFGTGVLAAVVLVALWSENHTSHHIQAPTAVMKFNSPSNTAVAGLNTADRNRRLASSPHVSQIRSRSQTKYFQRRSEIVHEPRLQVFPSPRPLSDQERLLAICVRNHRGAAILMARAQAEFNQEQEQEMQRLLSASNEQQNPE